MANELVKKGTVVPAVTAASSADDIKSINQDFSLGVFDGKERILKYDMNAFVELEKSYGTINNMVAKLQTDTASMADVRRMVWAGLLWDEAIIDEMTGEPIGYNITPFKVGQWITPDNMGAIQAAMGSAINGSLPTENEKN